MTFSYTSAFWTWEDWELQLDWLALRGVNLPLAWVGVEKIFVEVFQEIGLTDAEIATFFSGPAFQSWNRFGNIQGSWHGDLPRDWIDQQFELQKKIVRRMVELGMTPVLPAFAGFVPENITRVWPNASVVRGSAWEEFPTKYTNDSFLEPFDQHFSQIQSSFIKRQISAYGNVTNIYTLDQYNENDPLSGDLDDLRNITSNTMKSLKKADPNAIWMMQGWLFSSSEDFWTNERVEAYLSGVENNDDMIILDLFSESSPQWLRTNSYYGKPWIWCQLHGYGGNQGLYGQITNITENATQARLNSTSSLVGYGLSMEGQEGNEIVYDLLLDQAWSSKAIDTERYFHNWVTSRYSGSGTVPKALYEAWEMMRTTVYDNKNASIEAVTKSIFELRPNTEGLVGLTGHHATALTYDPQVLVRAWQLMGNATKTQKGLWSNPAYQYDMVDVTRQVLANAFIPLYKDLISTWNSSNSSEKAITQSGEKLFHLLKDIDSVLATNENFRLSTWIDSARALAEGNETLAAMYEYNARNQVTLWGPRGEVHDYASKQWSGLVSSYYLPRWEMFVDYLKSTPPSSFSTTSLDAKLLKFELGWQEPSSTKSQPSKASVSLKNVVADITQKWSHTLLIV